MTDLTVAEPLDFDFEGARIAPAPAELQKFVHEITGQTDYSGAEKRGRTRYQIAIEVPAIELDDDLRPLGEPFIAMSRDIYTGGICLVTRNASRPPSCSSGSIISKECEFRRLCKSPGGVRSSGSSR